MLDTDDRSQRALDLAYRYLNRCDRTVAEVRRHLERKGLEADAIERSIELLSEQSLLDDVRFARLFAHDKRELEDWGTERIGSELLRRGIERELIGAVLAEETPAAELDRALSLLRRRFPSPPADRRERDRQLGILLRKGYDLELAVDAVNAHARSERS